MNESTMPAVEATSYAAEGGVALITLTSPPVNALSAKMRQGILDGLARAAADPDVRAVVITGAGRIFCAGADITEFGKPPVAPTLPDLLSGVEESVKPVVAAINGAALGGGCELTLACHGRVGSAAAAIGLPEIKLGIIPGAGGTQRLPRILAPADAFAMMLKGDPVKAPKAKALGLLDEVVEADDLLPAARRLALAFADRGDWPVTGKRSVENSPEARAAFDAAAAEARKKSGDLLNTGALIRSVEAAFDKSLDDGLAVEREEFKTLVASDQSKALRHVFFAERAAARVPGIGKDVKARKVEKVAVIGAGTMGGGISMAFANAGIAVRVIETSEDLLAKGLERIRGTYAASVKRGSLSEADLQKRMALIEGQVGLSAAGEADMIIEAAFEDMGVKREIFGELARVAKPGAVIATNTSYLDVNEIASAAPGREADVIGLHFFSPANVMRLLEVVRGDRTAPDVLETGLSIGRKIGKLPVVSGVCFGFIGNRMLAQRTRAAERLLLSGVSPSEVDDAITGFGFRMGQFAMLDLAGIDIGWRTRKAFGGFAPIGDRLAELGRFGQKTGRGFYLYPEGARKGVPDPEVAQIIAEEAEARGVSPETLTGEEIVKRLFYPMVNEGARILEEGISYRPSDIDLVWINGYGWPSWTGGPMFWADGVGLAKIVASLEAQAKRFDAPELEPAPLLRRLAEEGKGFQSLKEGA